MLSLKAKKLYQEYRQTGLMFYSPKRRAGFVRRVKNLAGHIDAQATGQDNIGALMYLDHLAMWLDFDLTPHLKADNND